MRFGHLKEKGFDVLCYQHLFSRLALFDTICVISIISLYLNYHTTYTTFLLSKNTDLNSSVVCCTIVCPNGRVYTGLLRKRHVCAN